MDLIVQGEVQRNVTPFRINRKTRQSGGQSATAQVKRADGPAVVATKIKPVTAPAAPFLEPEWLKILIAVQFGQT